MGRCRGPETPKPGGRRIQELLDNLRVLQENTVRAFEQGDQAYEAEVATKLRTLVASFKSKRSVPLLLDLMDEHGYPGTLTPIRRGGIPRSFKEYLHEVCGAQAVPGHGLVEFTPHDLVLIWSSQLGGAHSDREVDLGLASALSTGFTLNGMPPVKHQLAAIARLTLEVGWSFVEELERKGLVRRVPPAAPPG